jgi:hypothetical protein
MKKEDPVIDGLEVDDFGKPVYLHGRECGGYCDYACNTPQGDQVAQRLEKYIPLVWTAKKPEKAGWYWYADEKRSCQIVQVFAERGNDHEVVFWHGSNQWLSTLRGVWAGPIPEPTTEGDEGQE